jgi:hypothetical protein
MVLHPIPKDIIIPGHSVSSRKPPCPRWEVPLPPQGDHHSRGTNLLPVERLFPFLEETNIFEKPHLLHAERFLPLPRENCPLGMRLLFVGKFIQLLMGDTPCSRARSNFWPPPQGHLPWGKTLTYFEVGVILVGIVSMDEVKVFGPFKSIEILVIPNVYILFNLYHGCIICKPPSGQIHP